MSWYWVLLLKPFLLFVFLVVFVLPFKLAAMKFLPEGKLKRILLFRLN